MSNNIYALVATQNHEEAEGLKAALEDIGVLTDVITSAAMLSPGIHYDLVIMSTRLLEEFKRIGRVIKSYIVVYSNSEEALSFGEFSVSCYFSKCPSYEIVKDIVSGINKPQYSAYDIVRTLYSLGLSSNLKGFRYVCTAVEMVIEDREYLSLITKRLYPELAKRFSTTSSAVERAVRHLVDKVFVQNTGTEIFMAMGYKRTRCTNAEFIALVADYVVMFKCACA